MSKNILNPETPVLKPGNRWFDRKENQTEEDALREYLFKFDISGFENYEEALEYAKSDGYGYPDYIVFQASKRQFNKAHKRL